MVASSTQIMAANRFGSRYELLRPLGVGGMGEVFLVRDLAVGRLCALKRLKSEARACRTALRREFETLTRIRHPAIVAVYDFAVAPDGTPFFTMEHVPGGSPVVRAGDWRSLLALGAEIAHGLEVLHAQGVIHGDLKPSNVLSVSADRAASVRLVDFGLATALGDGASSGGTSGFVAPEVVRGGPRGVASDLYALGATLFTVACGCSPFIGESPDAILRRQLGGNPERGPLEERGAPASLIDLVLQLLATDPRERPQTARDVRRELESIAPSIRRSIGERLETATLVGREPGLAAIEAYLGRKLQRSRMLVVEGRAGIGKRAFLMEVGSRAALAKHPVIRLSGPTIEPIQSVLRTLPEQSAWQSDNALDQALEREVRSLMETGSPRHPVFLVDTKQALDGLSRGFLRRALLHPEVGPSVWVITRDSDVPPPEDDRALADAGLVQTLTLQPLNEVETASLVAARLREVPSRPLMEFVWGSARGHPGLTIEALRRAASSGAIKEGDAGLVVDRAALAQVSIHPVVGDTRRAQLDALPASARRAVEVLAVQAGTAAELARIDHRVDSSALLQLRDLGFAKQGSGGRYELAWPIGPEDLDPKAMQQLHRDALALEGLLPAERFRHLRAAGDIAGALEAAKASLDVVCDPDLSRAAAELAESVDPLAAAWWHERTARELFKQGQYKVAVPLLERALSLDPARAPGLERLYLLSSAQLRIGDTQRARVTVTEALQLDPTPSLRSRLLTNDSGCLLSQGHLDRAAEVGQQAFETGRAAGDPEAEGSAAQTLAYVYLERGEDAEACAMAEVAVDSSRSGGTAFSRARAEGARAAVARAQGQPEEALARYQATLEFAREHGLRAVVEELLINRSVVLCELGRWAEFRQSNSEALRLSLEDHRPRNAAVAMANLAHADALTGRLRRARREARAAIRLARRHLPALESSAWRALAHAERAAGQMAAADRAARRAIELATERASATEIGWCRLEYGRVCAGSGRWDEAITVWRGGMDELPAGTAVLGCLMAACCGEGALHLGQMDRAAEDLNQVEDLLRGASAAPTARALGLRLKAELAIREDRLDEGMRLGAEALEALKQVPAPADHAATALALARAALERPDAHLAPIRDWLEEAAAAFERLGDYRARERALQHLVEWLGRRTEIESGGRGRRALFEAVSDLLTSLLHLPELAERAIRLVVDELAAERGVFLVVDPTSEDLTPLASHGALDAAARRQALGYSRKVVERVRSSGGSVLISDAPLDPRASSESVRRFRLRSIICTPLTAGGRVVGAVYLDDSRRALAFSEADRELLEGIANLLAVAVDRSLAQQEMERANEMLMGENRTLRREVSSRFRVQELVGSSLALQRILPLVERAAAMDTTVLLTGESGTGKELIAKIIHSNGKRRLRPFIPINCGAITDSLVESELFGIRPRIATGVQGRAGLFRQSDGGTLFLDEIGEMPLSQQVALFGVISSREVMPVGGEHPIPIDIRVIAATNRNLRQMVGEGSFREELYYRLNILLIEIPPLRDRSADLQALTQHFVAQVAAREKREVPELSKDFLRVIMRSRWPGNVRELQNYVERVMALTPGPVLHPRPLPEDLESRSTAIRGGTLAEELERLEQQRVREALERCDGNQTRAARELGLDEAGIRRRISKYGLEVNGRKRRNTPKRRKRT